MDSFRIVVTNPDSKKIRFVPYETNPDSFCIVDLESLMFSKDFVDSFCRLIFKRFDLFSRIQWVLTHPDESLVHRRTLNKPESIRILGFGFANPYWFQKIRFVDSFLKDLFRGFVSWKQKSQITRFVSFWKDSYTNPASLHIYLRLVRPTILICNWVHVAVHVQVF